MPRRCAPLALFATLTACATVVPRDADLREVLVHNPTRAAVTLRTVVRDGFGPARPLGDAARIELALPPGRYALGLGDGRPRVALPLPAAELGFVAPAAVEVTIEPPPPPPTEPGWCWVPAGPALRGDALGVGQEDERPLATPDTDAFWLAARETTNAQFVAFLNARGRAEVAASWLDLDGHKCRVQWSDAAAAFTTDAPALPVVTVSWRGAVAYCEWRTEVTGAPHRLPTETEWEKAARGPGSRVYAYGDTCRGDAANLASGRLREVGGYEPNAFGLYDMTGNAFEWCADLYDPRAYEPGARSTPADEFRVLRGGSFVLDGIFSRNAMRMRLRPDVRADDVGFRVLRAATTGR